jgi:hypothetical protein
LIIHLSKIKIMVAYPTRPDNKPYQAKFAMCLVYQLNSIKPRLIASPMKRERGGNMSEIKERIRLFNLTSLHFFSFSLLYFSTHFNNLHAKIIIADIQVPIQIFSRYPFFTGQQHN